MRYLYTSGMDFLAELLRQRIQDPKYLYKDEVGEYLGVATGDASESFFTANLPILSGADRHLRAGRWKYTEYATANDCSGKRGFTFCLESGTYLIPTNAIYATEGDHVKGSYTWISEQETSFRDEDLKLYLADAVNIVNQTYYDFGHSIVGNTASDLDISPCPSFNDVASYLYTMYSTILIQREIEAGSFADRIYVRDINITIDTSKGLGDLGRSIKELESRFNDVLNTFILKGQNEAFARIDTYSTYSYDGDYKFSSNQSGNSNF